MKRFYLKIYKKKIKKEVFLNKKINIYLCGPTVYNEVHIGNLRASIVIDVLIKSFIKKGIEFEYVQNITDIDDKIVKVAKEKKKSEKEISDFYKSMYIKNLKDLNINMPNLQSVTENVDSIIKFVSEIIKKNDAYVFENNIIFDIKKSSEYGKVSGQNLEMLSSKKARNINRDFLKQDEKDFVLWKKTETGLRWEDPWFKGGRPGWHTECASLVSKIFNGETIDIHAGGKDLIFPHHENERIQYLSVNGKEICDTWIHFGYIKLSSEKMSKSLKNLITIDEYIKNYGCAESLRLMILNSKYKDDIEINKNKIEQANRTWKKILNINKKIRIFAFENEIEIERILEQNEKSDKYVEIVFNNLDTAKLVFEMEKEISFLNKEMKKKKEKIIFKSISNFFVICELLGLKLKKEKFEKEEEEKIREWKRLINFGEFEKADRIREFLKKRMIV